MGDIKLSRDKVYIYKANIHTDSRWMTELSGLARDATVAIGL